MIKVLVKKTNGTTFTMTFNSIEEATESMDYVMAVRFDIDDYEIIA